MNLSIFYTDYIYTIIVAAVMVVSGYLQHYNITYKIYNFLSKLIPNKKWLLVILSSIGGILPIKGRVIASAGLFDMLIGNNTPLRPKFGVLNYIATHHYYLWSPLEKTILVPMAVLNLTYAQMLGYTWPLLLISLLMLFAYISWGLRDIDNFNLFSNEPQTPLKTPNPLSFINWSTLVFVYIAIVAGNFVKDHSEILQSYINHFQSNFFLVSLTAFIVSWILGSSGKFAGIVASLAAVYGIQYLPYFMALEFSAYLLSPTHKCNAISCGYFKTPIKHYTTVLIIWAVCIILYGISTLIGA